VAANWLGEIAKQLYPLVAPTSGTNQYLVRNEALSLAVEFSTRCEFSLARKPCLADIGQPPDMSGRQAGVEGKGAVVWGL
jgi:hypothetical protein